MLQEPTSSQQNTTQRGDTSHKLMKKSVVKLYDASNSVAFNDGSVTKHQGTRVIFGDHENL
jgi:hypothetical protein